MKLTIHVHLVPKLSMSGAISPLPLMHSLQLYLLHSDHTWRLQVLAEVLNRLFLKCVYIHTTMFV